MLIGRKRCGLLVAGPLFIVALAVATPAYPIPVTFEFTARLDDAINVSGVAAGDVVTGSVSYELNTLPYGDGSYNPTGHMSFSVGPVSVLSPEVWILVTHACGGECPGPTDDRVEFLAGITAAQRFTLAVQASFPLTPIPSVPPDLALAQWTVFSAVFSAGSISQQGSLYGTIETFTLAVPEPASNLLFALALCSAVLCRRSVGTP